MADFDLRSVDDVMILQVSGLMAHADCGRFRVMLEKAVRGTTPAPVIVDLSELEFICSTGMSLLVQYQRSLGEDQRQMVTTGLSGTVLETVEICGVDKLLATSTNLDAAIERVTSS